MTEEGVLFLKKVLLIGDSVRMGYDSYVKKTLRDTCEVVYPDENCRFAQYVLRYLTLWREWLQLDENVDLVHWNAGLWDTLILCEDGCLTPPEYYAFFIDKICNRIKTLFPKAKVIFATSTPIVESRFEKIAYRLNADVRAYNAIAVEICQKYGFAINDMYGVLDGVPEDYYIDCAHPYTIEGVTLTTNAVAKAISDALELNFREFVPDDEDVAQIQKKIDEVLGI